jgi:hypothetical protein
VAHPPISAHMHPRRVKHTAEYERLWALVFRGRVVEIGPFTPDWLEWLWVSSPRAIG